MNYKEILEWLFNQLPAYQKIGKSAYKADLSNIIKLAEHLGNPHEKFKSIHVGGTNGKGSSSHMLASVLQEAGYKVGLYTSPHLKDFRERIKINGKMISESNVVDFVVNHRSFFVDNSLSFFEMTVGMAFDFFANEKVDIAIVEVGLGGRLDATNIINPEVSLITNIGIDHTSFLGNDLKSIAFEKAGIIKQETPVVISETQVELEEVFVKKAKSVNAQLFFADQGGLDIYETDLLGEYQQKNSKGIVEVINQLKGFNVSDAAIKSGLKNVVKNTGLLGRWQILQEGPKVICDTAHNKEGLELTMRQLLNEPCEELRIVFGVVSDKDLTTILPLLPKDAHYYFCSPDIFRAMSVDVLYKEAIDAGLSGVKYNSVNEAFSASKNHSFPNDVIYVGGSTFVVAEIL
ncbi:MAG: bifunctional folylpolyglutamate synthase/dihydrofolate synthase [Flavobacteriaceae bacterium]|nr:bifunctional folylpolyglutamate synthase/dihydrofolate synthase [Flavobacteriaceae bacterium]